MNSDGFDSWRKMPSFPIYFLTFLLILQVPCLVIATLIFIQKNIYTILLLDITLTVILVIGLRGILLSRKFRNQFFYKIKSVEMVKIIEIAIRKQNREYSIRKSSRGHSWGIILWTYVIIVKKSTIEIYLMGSKMGTGIRIGGDNIDLELLDKLVRNIESQYYAR